MCDPYLQNRRSSLPIRLLDLQDLCQIGQASYTSPALRAEVIEVAAAYLIATPIRSKGVNVIYCSYSNSSRDFTVAVYVGISYLAYHT
jgi:hypothetical protein